ncbi:MAG: protein translocase subunit SecD [Deltaproteobacteria bacterium]|nr:protein translocase subunit SecD [Deltaproteobacteria bacterium]
MEKKRIWRSVLVFLLFLFSILYVLPTVLPEGAVPKWYPFTKRLNFGLDLKGGLELRYTVDYKKAILENSRDLMFRLQDYLVRESKQKEPGDEVLKEELDAVRSKVTFTVPSFDTVRIETTDETLRGFITTEAVEDKIDPRYTLIEQDGAILLKMRALDVERIKKEVVDQTLSIIRKRVEAFGLVEPDVRMSGDSDIDVQLPGVSKEQMEVVRERIGQTARLTFRIVDSKSDFFADVKQDLEAFRQQSPEKGKTVEIAKFGDRYQARSEKKSNLVAFIHFLQKERKLPDDHVAGYYFVEEDEGGRVVKSYYRTEYLFAAVRVSGDHLARSGVFYKDSGEPYVSLTFTGQGATLFEEVTGEHVGDYLAIMLDDDINSAPVIKEVIAGGQASITLGGNRSASELLGEAQSLVTVLTHGAYKAPVHKIQDHEVGPSLGKDAIDAGVLSFVVGALAVLLFMGIYYRVAGIIANLALAMNMVFIVAILVAFNSALTLPGLAGLVLTLGMAVDANVIIYERIREELRAGKTARVAIETGYSKSFWTIFDSQLTTALAGVILMNFTTGPVYGFAVTLLVGIVCSVFTALYVTKLFYQWMLDRKLIKETVSI